MKKLRTLASVAIALACVGSVAPLRAQSDSPNMPTDWWSEIGHRPDSWYRSDEGRRFAENILSWQDESGGWPLMNVTNEPFTGDVSRAGPWGTRGGLIGATVDEIRFMGRAYRVTQDEGYRDAALRGLDFIYEAQYPTGGWPHSYPIAPGSPAYYVHATFNDSEMPDLMTLLSEVATSPDFAFLGRDGRARARAAFERGVDFVLKSQIRVDGVLTAWAQQHDWQTYEPRPGRAFEPVAISGAESASVLHMLMDIDEPSPEVVAAIEAGVAWYHRSQIDGLEVVYTGDDRIARPNPDARPLWARFYEIGTNRPIFAGRDGVVRYSMAEIEQERRRGYAWYGGSGTRVFEHYALWLHDRKWDDLPPTNTDEAAVRSYTLPPVLTASDGRRITSVEEWRDVRRPELLDLAAQNEFGITPDRRLRTVNEVIERDARSLDGAARRTQVRIRFPDFPNGPVIRVALVMPADADGPVPVLLHIGFSPNVAMLDEPGMDEGMAWSRTLEAPVPDREATWLITMDPAYFIARGYGVALVYYGDIDPDFDHGGRYGVRSMFGSDGEPREPTEWGSMGGWAWGLSRVMDYLVSDPRVDPERVAVSGMSRLGKATLWAAAQDERFALAIPMASGEGGAAISRRNYGETVADLTNPQRYDYWYAPSYADYAFDVDALPIDGHSLVALVAPRPILLVVGTEDTWSDPKGEWVSAQAAEPAYALFGLSGVGDAPEPPVETLVGDDIGLFMHVGPHTVLPEDYKAMADFMDRHFGR